MTHLTLHFVRHGETDFNAERRVQGQMMEVGLSALGLEQAEAVAGELAACRAGALYASDLRRAMQTATPIARTLGLEIIQEPALRERHFGIAQGQLYEDVIDIMREWWTRHDEEIEGGETNRQMYQRIAAFLDSLRTDPPCDEVLLITHGGTINMALAQLAGLPIEEMEWQRVANCAVTTIEVPVLQR